MKKIYYLSSCDTCRKILKEIGADVNAWELQDIKTQPILEEQLEEMKALAGSYEALFSRKALKYRSMGLHEKQLSEKDYKELILQEYTFLKRPVAIANGEIFIGNTKVVVEKLKQLSV